MKQNNITSKESLQDSLPAKMQVIEWLNVGGQLIPKLEVQKLLKAIVAGKTKNWESVHQFYLSKGQDYAKEKALNAFAALKVSEGIDLKKADKLALEKLLLESIATKQWMAEGIHASRAKDYQNEFRKMVYENDAEMNKVLGALKDNGFIKQEFKELQNFKTAVETLIVSLKK
jgi:hypothetical protein